MAASGLTTAQEEKLSNLAALTGADVKVATKFLEACSWNVEVAVDRYFTNPDPSQFDINNNNRVNHNNNNNNNNNPNNNGGNMDAASAALAQQLANGGGGIGSGGGGGGVQGQPAVHPAASALNQGILNMLGMSPQQLMAQQMMGNRQYVPNGGGGGSGVGGSGGGGGGNGGYDPQSGVRRADAAYREQMLPDNFDVQGRNERRVNQKDRMQNFSNEWQQGSGGPRSARQDALSKMFAEPSYRFIGTLEDAKVRGQEKNAWILVNIQSADDFSSHCLNRDVWNETQFSEMVQACFIFYQWTKEQSRGQKFVNLYHITKIPCLCIIDPNTGRKEHEFTLPENPTAVPKIKDDVIDFLDKHPNPKAKPKNIVPVAPSSKQKVMSHEDELLAAAIEASMADAKEDDMQNKSKNNNNNNNNNSNNNSSNDSNNDKDKVNTNLGDNTDVDIDMSGWNGDDNDNDAEFQNEMSKLSEKEKENEKKKYELEAEPASMNRQGTAIRVRMPDGKMLQRRFLKTSKIQQLYTFIYLTEGKENFRLFTQMPKTYLDDSKEKTFEGMNLLRATVVCAFD